MQNYDSNINSRYDNGYDEYLSPRNEETFSWYMFALSIIHISKFEYVGLIFSFSHWLRKLPISSFAFLENRSTVENRSVVSIELSLLKLSNAMVGVFIFGLFKLKMVTYVCNFS